MFNKSFVAFFLKYFFSFKKNTGTARAKNETKTTHIPTINRNNFLKLETRENLKWTNKVLKLEEQT